MHHAQRLFVALEVGDQHLDRQSGHAAADLADGVGEDARAANVVVVAVDAGDDGELQSQLLDGFGHAARLVEIDGCGRALGHGAETAAPRADIAQQHEGRGAVVPALADVGAVRRLANRVQVEACAPAVFRP